MKKSRRESVESLAILVVAGIVGVGLVMLITLPSDGLNVRWIVAGLTSVIVIVLLSASLILSKQRVLKLDNREVAGARDDAQPAGALRDRSSTVRPLALRHALALALMPIIVCASLGLVLGEFGTLLVAGACLSLVGAGVLLVLNRALVSASDRWRD